MTNGVAVTFQNVTVNLGGVLILDGVSASAPSILDLGRLILIRPREY